MKQLILFCIAILCGSQAIAQTYPVGSYWRYRDELHDRVHYKFEALYLITPQQQVVAGRMSNRLVYRTSDFNSGYALYPDVAVGWYAEENNTGYVLTDDGIMIKIFDYNRQVGEMMPFARSAVSRIWYQSEAKITDIQTKNIDGVQRKVFVLDNGALEMIEHVGIKDNGLFKLEPSYGDYNTSTPGFVCFTDGKGLYYTASTTAVCKYMTATPTQWPVSVGGLSTAERIGLYPNPSSSVLHIQAPANTTAEVYDMVGRLVVHTTAPTINTSAWRDGLYVVKLYDDRSQLIKTEKVLKQ
jgi:hypothetical protein